jgi:chromosome segregation ATPase
MKWYYDKTDHMRCGENYEVFHFLRGDESKEWTLHEVTEHLSAMEAELAALRAEVERLRVRLASLAETGTGYSQQSMDAVAGEREELRAEVERLREALLEAQTLCANNNASDAVYAICEALMAGEKDI